MFPVYPLYDMPCAGKIYHFDYAQVSNISKGPFNTVFTVFFYRSVRREVASKTPLYDALFTVFFVMANARDVTYI